MSKHFRIERGPAQKLPRPLSPVVVAGPGDSDALIDFLRSVRGELDGGAAEDDEVEQLARALANRDLGAAFIVRDGQRIEGSLGIQAVKRTLSRTHWLRVVWFAVLPEARLTGHAKSLLIAARGVADQLNRPLFAEESTPLIDTPKARLIARHIPSAGTIFTYMPGAAA